MIHSTYQPDETRESGPIRLQKFLAWAGVTSRRAAEELIRAGRVRVDGVVVCEMGVKADPSRQVVEVDGTRVFLPHRLNYLILHKPRGVVTTVREPQGRDTVMRFLSGIQERVYPVGRLDKESEGLLFFTNDGPLAHRLIHPRFKVEKEYVVTVAGHPRREDIRRIEAGIEINGKTTLPCRICVMGKTATGTTLDVVLREGRKRQIREMFAAIGFRVDRLMRIRLGPIQLGGLKPGRWRRLGLDEVEALKRIVFSST